MIESKLTKTGYELESVHIVQAPISDIEHRSECNPMIDFYGRKIYPVIVSPMGAVTNELNYKVWLEHGFLCVVPRTVQKTENNPNGISFEERVKISQETFVSFSLNEARYLTEHLLINRDKRHFICIDIAHGTMKCLYDVCKTLKTILGEKVVIMTGNVANPQAYAFYEDAGIDIMRACIGTGSRCVCEGTQILMADGTTLPIEDIDVGDVVKTCNGNKKVTKTFSKKIKETIIINDEIETTPEHKFLVVKKSDAEACDSDEKIKEMAFYLEAKYITNEYLLVKD